LAEAGSLLADVVVPVQRDPWLAHFRFLQWRTEGVRREMIG
jgi:hypothetical protein